MCKLINKIILITGSTAGIGAACARLCVELGAKVMVHGRDQTRAKSMVKALGQQAHYCLGDLADPGVCETIVKKTVEQFGRIDGLVNNGAFAHPVSDIDSSDAAMFDRIVHVNLRSPLLVTRAAVREFRRQKSGGTIVNIGSINAYTGQSDLLVYSMTKGGLMTMTRNLADTLGPEKIRINQLNVGWTVTENEIKLKQKEGLPEGWQHDVPELFAPFGQLLSPENVAEHVAFWISDHSAPVSGSVYEVEQYPVIGRNRIGDR